MAIRLVFDCEVYKNYFLVAFRNVVTGNVRTFEMNGGDMKDERATVEKILRSYQLVSFNGLHYDIPILSAYIAGRSCAQIKAISDDIIQKNLKPWIVAKAHRFQLIEDLDHIDLIEVAPGIASLKIYGGRLHTKRMQDLPYEHTAELTLEQMEVVRNYCRNDLQLTLDLLRSLEPQIALRAEMSDRYGIDLRSKSDAQMAEAIIKEQVGNLLERNIKPPTIAAGTEFRYALPPFIKFKTPQLIALAREIFETPFVVGDGGGIELPLNLKKRVISVGAAQYQLGIGGLHSKEHSAAHYADADHRLIDRDVRAYYPSIILMLRLFPKQMGEAFLKVYKAIVDARIFAKEQHDLVTDLALKIVINGSFGKFGSKWSALYAPDLLIQTTITGQLSLLMLIEAAEEAGVPVVSANTDGLVFKIHKDNFSRYEEIVEQWESQTGFVTEATEYAAIYSRDVNNYIAIKLDGKGTKTKGVYAPAMLAKNPMNQICIDAIIARILHGKDIRETIDACTDVRKFVNVRQVKGGGVYGDEYLGKAVRWYYSNECRGRTINYKINGNTVARTEGCRPLMQLPEAVPGDVDIDWYVNEACSMLVDMGAV